MLFPRVPWLASVLTLAALAAGCGDVRPADLDAGSTLDGGATLDAGEADGGDAQVPADAQPVDAGLPQVDAGPLADGGSGPVGAGSSTDGGLASVDAGPEADAGPCGASERWCMGGCRACPTHSGITRTACTGGTCFAAECAPGLVVGDDTCYSAASPELAPLYDTARISLPHECEGEPLSAAELRALFPRGYGRLSFREGTFEESLGSVPRFTVRQVCHPATGCAAATVERAWGYDLNAQFELSDTGVITFVHYAVISGGSPVVGALGVPSAVASGDFLINAVTAGGPAARGRVTREAGGSVCFSTLSGTASSSGANYSVTRVTIPAPAAGSVPGDAPPFTSASRCVGPAASNASIIAAWFESGADEARFSTAANRVEEAFRRSCHAQTGCSAWRSMTARYALDRFDFDAAFALRVQLDQSFGAGSARLWFPLAAGAYSGTADIAVDGLTTPFSFSGIATEACVDQALTRPSRLDLWAGPGSTWEEGAQVRYLR